METIDKATEIFQKYYKQWESDESRMENGYQYEYSFQQMMQKIEQEVLSASTGEIPTDKNEKKKLHTRSGEIIVSKYHVLGKSLTRMNISSLAQETMCYVGQSLVFEQASKMINSLTGANFNAKQIERICHHYGSWLEAEDEQKREEHGYRSYDKEEAEALHYVMMDGAMYPTREKEEPWKEIKLGRIINSNEILPLTEHKNFIPKSTYVAHLGSLQGFFPKLEYEIERLKNKVFVADGAKWIWNWVEDIYPDSIQILDFFHAKEHLCDFAKLYFTDQNQRTNWIEKQVNCWMEETPENVIDNIKELEIKDTLKKEHQNLLNYYTSNLERMRYKEFKEKGLYIGSGAIESAHKSVLQERLKLSGQHWTKDGLQQMAQLRVVYNSGQQSRITNLLKKSA